MTDAQTIMALTAGCCLFAALWLYASFVAAIRKARLMRMQWKDGKH